MVNVVNIDEMVKEIETMRDAIGGEYDDIRILTNAVQQHNKMDDSKYTECNLLYLFLRNNFVSNHFIFCIVLLDLMQHFQFDQIVMSWRYFV